MRDVRGPTPGPAPLSARPSWTRGLDGFEAERATIRRIREEVHSVSDRFVVLLVLNTKPEGGATTTAGDYLHYSVTSESFSAAEREELTEGFASIGCPVDVSDGEKEFNERLVRGDFERYGDLRRVVYHSTGAGTGRCRSTFIPALCRLYGIANCSSDVYTSTILENKVHLFNLLSFYGIATPSTWFYDARHGWLTGEPPASKKVIAKPAYECASVGVSDASVSPLTSAFRAHVHGLSEELLQPILVQEFVDGYEVEVPVFDLGEPFTPMSMGIEMSGSPCAGDRFLTYDMVYDDRYDFYPFCLRHPRVGAEVRRIARDSFRTLGLSGMTRVDFRVQEQGRAVIIDYNNAPHLPPFHSCARAVTELGFEYGDMLCLLLYDHVRSSTGHR